MSNFRLAFRFSWFALIVLPVGGCAKKIDSRILVTGHGSDKPDPVCERFQLTPEQVAAFFGKAKPFSASQLHEFDYLPCWVAGTKTDASGFSKWKIHPIGIVEVTHPDGKHEMLGCKDCVDLLE